MTAIDDDDVEAEDINAVDSEEDLEADYGPVEYNSRPMTDADRKKVMGYIDGFFADKMFYCGGTIPKRFLHDPQRMHKVFNFNIIKGVDEAYRYLKHSNPDELAEFKRMGKTTDDVKMVNETLKLLSRSSIPQKYAGGMMLMYLELVEGVDFES